MFVSQSVMPPNDTMSSPEQKQVVRYAYFINLFYNVSWSIDHRAASFAVVQRVVFRGLSMTGQMSSSKESRSQCVLRCFCFNNGRPDTPNIRIPILDAMELKKQR
ncbi:hypothetical protein ACP4OV_014655 [Aristida adscensionis]